MNTTLRLHRWFTLPLTGLTMVLAAHTPLNTLMHSPCSAASPPMLCSSPSDYLWTSTRLSRNYRLFLDDNCVGSCHIQESLRIFTRSRHLGGFHSSIHGFCAFKP